MNKKERKIVPDNDTSNDDLTHSIINEELKSLQRAIDLLRQDLPKIINDELIKFLNNRQGRRF